MMVVPFDFIEDGSQCSAEVVLPNMPLRGRTTSRRKHEEWDLVVASPLQFRLLQTTT